ncbi:RidA family protein [Salinicoccus sp. YB14-2]|uniref:RidA family protein n=1 Tax=Salinicoccus sp. YB14-2 TaxID=1572701 RepID=UPI0012E14D8E|nr:RidA family protein [Salinicoccus sp. YB14-2]
MENNVIPNGNYRLAARDGDKVYTSGITPKINGQLVETGKLDNQTDLSGYESVTQQAVKNALQVIEQEMHNDEKIEQIVMMTVYVNASEGFEFHSQIADFASDYLVEVLGKTVIGSRAAVGVGSLPGNSPLEISLIAKIKSKS